jgi:5'-3' exonuclease
MKINTLLIDGESLLKQGYYGTKKIQTEHGSIGAVYHFLNKIREFYSSYGITKVVVFWEGENSRQYRQSYYPNYKTKRVESQSDNDEKYDLGIQRVRVQQYLEELFIRQVVSEGCEADDGIAVYCKNSKDEFKTIYTADRDLLQLISDDTRVFLSDKRYMVSKDNFKNLFEYHYENVGLIKMLCGDKSDNISGLENVGIETVMSIFPELKEEKVDVDFIINKVDLLLEENPKSKKLLNIKEGKTKWGVYGKEYFSIMDKVINLNNPYITEDLLNTISDAVNEPLCPDGRGGIKSAMKMAMEDGINTYIPKSYDGAYGFWGDFLSIINKEKNFNKHKNKSHE